MPAAPWKSRSDHVQFCHEPQNLRKHQILYETDPIFKIVRGDESAAESVTMNMVAICL